MSIKPALEARSKSMHTFSGLTREQNDPYSGSWDTTLPDDWDRLLLKFRDGNLEQTARYPGVRARGGSYWRLKVSRRNEIVGLCVVRVYRVPFLSFGVGVVAKGPLWRRNNTPPNLGDLAEIISLVRSRVCESAGLELVIKPALYTTDDAFGEIATLFKKESFVLGSPPGATPLMNLSADVDTLRKGLHQKWRNRLVSAERQGMKVTFTTGEADFDRFMKVYKETRERKAFREAHDPLTFLKFFNKLEQGLRPTIALCVKDEHVLAGAVLSSIGDTAIYHFGGTTLEGMKRKASNLLQWRAVQWAKGQGCSRYDLGGSSKSHPWFKNGLCGRSGSEVTPLGEFWYSGAPSRPWLRSTLSTYRKQ